jgi:hypothetical protein
MLLPLKTLHNSAIVSVPRKMAIMIVEIARSRIFPGFRPNCPKNRSEERNGLRSDRKRAGRTLAQATKSRQRLMPYLEAPGEPGDASAAGGATAAGGAVRLPAPPAAPARYLNGRYSGSPMSVIIQLLSGFVSE